MHVVNVLLIPPSHSPCFPPPYPSPYGEVSLVCLSLCINKNKDSNALKLFSALLVDDRELGGGTTRTRLQQRVFERGDKEIQQ